MDLRLSELKAFLRAASEIYLTNSGRGMTSIIGEEMKRAPLTTYPTTWY